MSLHFPTASVSDRKWQPTCEIGPGFHYWSVILPMPYGQVGHFRRLADAERVAAAYRDPDVTRASIDAAWGRAVSA
jgi:hypothetical protein